MTVNRLRSIVLFLAVALLVGLNGCGLPLDNAFMGDSITRYWTVPGANLGVSGNTTAQMLARYPTDVPGRGFRVFVLLGGTNDLLQHKPVESAIANIAAMAQQAKAAGMVVVLCELPPDYEDPPVLLPWTLELNGLIKELAKSEGYLLVDYFDPMIGHPEYFRDKLHPNAEGYQVMDEALIPVLESIPQ